ncbi:MAG: fumarate hydratase C-terminal domain-containing protein [Chloroflexi bacterium]|nr:fumarate hydratase C-terminal domain-containing protein [Chloroflexota bacterium]
MATLNIVSPFAEDVVARLHAGDQVSISGVVYAARDAAHKRLVEALAHPDKSGLPFDIRGQTIYYVGPTPAKPGEVIGSAGPTTSSRMDPYTPRLLEAGLRATIGKGGRSAAVREALVRHKALYLATIAGAGVLLSRRIRRAELVAYGELGPEAILRLEVEDFPAIVINDIYGADWFQMAKAQYARPAS